ncbi:hypothetical protein ACIQC5_02855 [Paenarthrobacter sp. NPDC092416]|uniref:hypothetical protein n=1 Tax=Paenarthrobacter sp. NPDC092416 TaxID=3364386 RepID=UPI0037F68177
MAPRKLGPGVFSRRKLAALRHTRSPEHLESCEQCKSALHRERQYLERLRGASVPEASQDLAARLIQHTERLAQEPDFLAVPGTSRPGTWRGLRMAGVAAGGLAVSAGVLAVAAYAVGGEPVPEARLAGNNDVGLLSGALTSGHSDGAAMPAFTAGSTVSLSSDQLDMLRDDGWACPELSAMGFRVVSAQATMHNGHPAVELRLESNGHYATVVEEHLKATDLPAASASTSAQLSITQGTPWEAVYRTSATVLSYTSDLPADKADDAVPELVRAGESMLVPQIAQDSEAWSDRLVRGLRTLLRPAGL